MNLRLLFILALLPAAVHAAPRSSASYTIATDTADARGVGVQILPNRLFACQDLTDPYRTRNSSPPECKNYTPFGSRVTFGLITPSEPVGQVAPCSIQRLMSAVSSAEIRWPVGGMAFLSPSGRVSTT